MTIRFDEKVAIVTGAGGGIGKQHALELARRGAKVVVNDLGGSVDGSGASDAANEVVELIKSEGGEAISNGASVTDLDAVKAMVDQTMTAWGRVDILVNNAGILRDKSFHKVTLEDFNLVMDVHFQGSLNCTHTVFPIMRDQEYGRIIFTSSSSGVFGNFGQTNYGSAKMAMIGLMNTLKIEGQKNNIKVNSLIPVAATRMTENLGMPEAVFEQLKPESVSPAVLFMASEEAPTGIMLSAGAGVFAKVEISQAAGVGFAGDEINPDSIADHWSEISDMSNAKQLFNGGEHTAAIFSKVKK